MLQCRPTSGKLPAELGQGAVLATTAQAQIAGAEAGRDHGLVRGMGAIGLAAAIANEVVGAGIFRLPAAMAAAAGTSAPLAYVACLVAMGAIVLCCAEAGSRVPTSGGIAGTVGAAFGPLTGFVAGVLLYVSCVLALGGVAAALAETAGSAVPALGQAGPRAIFIVVVLGAIAWLNVAGVGLASRIISWATLIKLLPLLLFVGVGAYALANGQGTTNPIVHAPGEGFGEAVILAMFALSGMESPLAASGEVRDPTRNIARGLLLAMGTVGLLYIAIQYLTQALLGQALITSKTPLADAMGLIDPRLRALLLAGAFLSMLCWLASDLLGAPRVLFAFARDGLLPKMFGALHPRWKTPHIAILIHAMAAAALAITGTFVQLAILATLATAGLYFLGCAAALLLRRRGVAILGRPIVFPALPIIAVVGMISMVVLIGLAKWGEIAGFVGVTVASALLYVAMRGRRAASTTS